MSERPALPDNPEDADDRPTTASPLETRYRRVLRLLPMEYRAVREQEMVDAFVASSVDADPEIADVVEETGWPSLRESASVGALALRLRWADPHGPRRYQVMTGALRYAALVALAVFAVMAASGILSMAQVAAAPPRIPGFTTDAVFGTVSVWSMIENWSYVLWIPALLLATLGGHRAATWALTAAAVPVAVGVLVTIPSLSPLNVVDWTWLAAQVAVLVGLAGMVAAPERNHQRRRSVRLLAVTGGLVVFEAIVLVVSAAIPWLLRVVQYGIVDTAGFWCVATMLAAAALLARRIRRARVGPDALLGLALLAGAATVTRAGALPIMLWAWTRTPHQVESTGMLISAVVQLVLVATITVTTGILAGRRIRRMPPVSYRPDGMTRRAQ